VAKSLLKAVIVALVMGGIAVGLSWLINWRTLSEISSMLFFLGVLTTGFGAYGMLGSSTQITRPANIAGVPQSQTPDNSDAASLARERRAENTRSIASRLISALGGGVIMLAAAYLLGEIAMRQ
jgi:hypothetical protein